MFWLRYARSMNDRRAQDSQVKPAGALRLFLWVAISLLLPGGIALLAWAEVRRDAVAESQAQLQRTARSIAEAMDAQLLIAQTIMTRTAQAVSAAGPGKRPDAQAALTEAHQIAPAFLWLVVADKNGRILRRSAQTEAYGDAATLSKLVEVGGGDGLLRIHEPLAKIDQPESDELIAGLDVHAFFANLSDAYLAEGQTASVSFGNQPHPVSELIQADMLEASADVAVDGLMVTVRIPVDVATRSASQLAARLAIGATLLLMMALAAAVFSGRRQRLFQAEINRAYQLQNVILQGADTLIMSLDEQGLIQAFNVAGQRMTQYSESEVVHKLPAAVILQARQGGTTERHQPELVDVLRLARAAGRVTEVLDVVTRDLRRTPVLVTAAYLGSRKGEAGTYVLTCTDISERLAQERIKSEFISTVSHELRTPLTSIRGALGLISSSDASKPLSDVGAFVQIAESNCDRLIGLVNDILDMEKLSAGQIELRPEFFDLRDLVQEVVRDQAPFASKCGSQIDVVLPDEPVQVHLDRARTGQVLINLLSNAAKFGGAHGPVVVELEQVGMIARLRVRDAGPGIPEDFRDRLFDRFSQRDGSNTKAQNGTGLGLAIARDLIREMSGELVLESGNVGATCFRIELHCHQLVSAGTGAYRPQILVVDGPSAERDALETALQGAGYEVYVVDGTQLAYRVLAEEQFAAMVVTDRQADGDILTLLEAVRGLPGAAHLPTVVGIEPGSGALQGWLQRPLREVEVVRAVSKCAQRHEGEARPRILVLSDHSRTVRLFEVVVGKRAEVLVCTDESAVQRVLEQGPLCAVVLDLNLSKFDVLNLVPMLSDKERIRSQIVVSTHDYQLPVRGNVIASVDISEPSIDALLAAIEQQISTEQSQTEAGAA